MTGYIRSLLLCGLLALPTISTAQAPPVVKSEIQRAAPHMQRLEPVLVTRSKGSGLLAQKQALARVMQTDLSSIGVAETITLDLTRTRFFEPGKVWIEALGFTIKTRSDTAIVTLSPGNALRVFFRPSPVASGPYVVSVTFNTNAQNGEMQTLLRSFNDTHGTSSIETGRSTTGVVAGDQTVHAVLTAQSPFTQYITFVMPENYWTAKSVTVTATQ